MKINSSFDGGNIICLDCSSPENITLEIEKDNNSNFFQWFFFRLSEGKNQTCNIKILNAGSASYPMGWEHYRVVASYDRQDWFRIPTNFDGNILSFLHRPERDSVYYAYFPPYSTEMHHNLISKCLNSTVASLDVLGTTLDDRDIDLLRIGTSTKDKLNLWAIARQHPGETMAEWWMEGFLGRLLDRKDPVSEALLEKANFYVVPNMNPDGSFRGHLRTNSAGINLNREWQKPSLEQSPEVFYVRQQMEQTGVDFCLDVHGDEAIPYNFIVGPEGIPSFSKRQAKLLKKFKLALLHANSDFQLEEGYPQNQPGQANLNIGANWIAERFGCLSMTLEQPFKDLGNEPLQRQGWSPARCMKLGESCLDAIYNVIDRLR